MNITEDLRWTLVILKGKQFQLHRPYKLFLLKKKEPIKFK